MDAGQVFAARLRGVVADGLLALVIGAARDAGVFAALAGGDAVSAAEVAARTGLGEGKARAWLAALAAGGVVDYDGARDRFELPAEHAAPLADARLLPAARRLVPAARPAWPRVTEHVPAPAPGARILAGRLAASLRLAWPACRVAARGRGPFDVLLAPDGLSDPEAARDELRPGGLLLAAAPDLALHLADDLGRPGSALRHAAAALGALPPTGAEALTAALARAGFADVRRARLPGDDLYAYVTARRP
jgi:hypothetical protein